MYIVAHLGARVWGGAERAVSALLAGLQGRGHRVLLLCNDVVVAEPARALGIEAELCPLGGDASLHHAVRLARRLRRERPDALLVGMFKKVWLAGLAGRMAGIPRIVARVGLESDVPRNAKYRFAFRHLVDHLVVVAERLRPAFAALPGWDGGRISVIPNAVRPPGPARRPGGVRAELGIAPDAPCVGVVARLAAQKRIDRLLDAVALLPPEVHCIVAGDGPWSDRLRDHAAALGIGPRVHLLGEREPAEVLAALDVYALTSDQEGMSNAMLEALAAGVPVVSTDVSGSEDALRPAPDGSVPGIVVPFDAGAVAAAVGGLLRDPARRAAMSAEAVRRVAERFSFDAILDRWELALRPPAAPSPA